MSGFIEKDGRVGVVISPDYGSGFVSEDSKIDPFDAEMVSAILSKDKAALLEVVSRKYPSVSEYTKSYLFGDLEVEWVPKGSVFRIHEYDGSERIVFQNEDRWFTAPS